MNTVRPIVVPGASALTDSAAGLPKAMDFWSVDDLAAQYPYFAAMAGDDATNKDVALNFAQAGGPVNVGGRSTMNAVKKFALSMDPLSATPAGAVTYSGGYLATKDFFRLRENVPFNAFGYTFTLVPQKGDSLGLQHPVIITEPRENHSELHSLSQDGSIRVGSSYDNDFVIPSAPKYAFRIQHYDGGKVAVVVDPSLVAPSQMKYVDDIWDEFVRYLKEPQYSGMERLKALYSEHRSKIAMFLQENKDACWKGFKYEPSEDYSRLLAFNEFMDNWRIKDTSKYDRRSSVISTVNQDFATFDVTQPHLFLTGRETHIALPQNGRMVGVNTQGGSNRIEVSIYGGGAFLLRNINGKYILRLNDRFESDGMPRCDNCANIILKRYGLYFCLPQRIDITLEDGDELYMATSYIPGVRILGEIMSNPQNSYPTYEVAPAKA